MNLRAILLVFEAAHLFLAQVAPVFHAFGQVAVEDKSVGFCSFHDVIKHRTRPIRKQPVFSAYHY